MFELIRTLFSTLHFGMVEWDKDAHRYEVLEVQVEHIHVSGDHPGLYVTPKKQGRMSRNIRDDEVLVLADAEAEARRKNLELAERLTAGAKD